MSLCSCWDWHTCRPSSQTRALCRCPTQVSTSQTFARDSTRGIRFVQFAGLWKTFKFISYAMCSYCLKSLHVQFFTHLGKSRAPKLEPRFETICSPIQLMLVIVGDYATDVKVRTETGLHMLMIHILTEKTLIGNILIAKCALCKCIWIKYTDENCF